MKIILSYIDLDLALRIKKSTSPRTFVPLKKGKTMRSRIVQIT